MIVGLTEGVIAFCRTIVSALAVFEAGAWIATAVETVRGRHHAAGGVYLAVTLSILLAAVGGMAWRSHTRVRVAIWTSVLFIVAVVGGVPLLSL
jgi:hypothetical protein